MDVSIIFEIFDDLSCQGLRSNKCTEKAFIFILSIPSEDIILDIVCGVGMKYLHFATICIGFYITTTDIHQPYLDRLMGNATEKEFADRITTVCAAMDNLPFDNEKFDRNDLLCSKKKIW